MPVIPLLVVHVLGSFLVAFAGRRRRIGYFGFLLVSLLITPILALLMLFITTPRKDPREA
jgi:hypothetical protein